MRGLQMRRGSRRAFFGFCIDSMMSTTSSTLAMVGAPGSKGE